MDKNTVEAYTAAASDFADDWLNQPAPTDMYEILERFFVPGGSTVDIGCGTGRDVAWLNDKGYPTLGFDASDGLIKQATSLYPHLSFRQAILPELAEIEPNSFDNILCETVIMHLAPEQIGDACSRLLDILKPGGVLYLSWRVTESEHLRDKLGRLYSAFSAELVINSLGNAEILLNDKSVNKSSGKSVHRLVVTRRSA